MLVPLTNSDTTAIIDNEWEEDVLGNDQKWFLDHAGYVQSTVNTGCVEYRHIYLHQLIAGIKPGFEIDHINGNKLDNRTANLRHVTHIQQMQNRRIQSNNTSGHKGVWFNSQKKKWAAEIKVNKQKIDLGRFGTFAEACAVRKEAEQTLHGEYARKAGGR